MTQWHRRSARQPRGKPKDEAAPRHWRQWLASDLLTATPGPGLKYRAALSIFYGAGLRAAKICSLKVGDIVPDPKRLSPKRVAARVGTTGVLHTWGRGLTHHPHFHRPLVFMSLEALLTCARADAPVSPPVPRRAARAGAFLSFGYPANVAFPLRSTLGC